MLCFHRASRTLLLASAAIIAAGAAHAQDTTNPATASPDSPHTDNASSVQTVRTDNGQIIVTARHYVPEGAETANKANIPLIETPQSVSVVTRDQIDLLNFIDAQQAVRYTAGVFGENYGPDPRYDFVTVRGFTPKQYIDGLAVPATTTIAATGVDLYAFQSLDILKGPSSALYGLAPPGGIINETSRRASSTFGGEIEGKYGSHNFAELAGTLTGPVTPWLDARFTTLYRDADGEVDHTHIKRLLAAPTATIKFDSRTKLTGLLYYQYDEVHGGAGGFLPIYGTLLPNPNGRIKRSTNLDDPADLFERRQYGIGYDFEHRFSDAIIFHSNAKWSHYHEATPIGLYSGGGFINTTDPTKPSYYRDLQQYNFSYMEKVSSFAIDNRLDATFDTGPIRHKLLLGLDYRNVRNVAADNFVFAGIIDAFDPVYNPAFERDIGYPTRYNQQRFKQTGVYGQDQIKLGDLYVLLGGRYDWVKTRTAAPFTPMSTPAVFGPEQSQHKFTYRIGANYVTSSGIAPYVSYATSFEPVLGTDSATGKPLQPTTTHQWEGGVKYDARGLPSDVKLFATIAGFDIKESNFVSPQVGITPVFVTQGGQVEVYGAEAELVARIHDQLTINASYSYNHSKVLSSVSEPADVGYPLPVTPKHKASLFVDYTLQKGPLAGFGAGFGARYTSKSTGALPGQFGTPVIYADSATLFDAILHYDIPGWRFAVNGSNIFDKRYVARCASFYGCVYGAGRQIIGTITKKF
ncbi:MAG TPA: TonB-dependent siderophore receptor [Sphingomonas sp.]|nr:TonB-dependent siderophore receptor [Sphingomonas sp.]